MASLWVNNSCILDEVDVVLFDKDGTLIDIHHYWASMIKIRALHIVEKWFKESEDRDLIENSIVDAMGVDLRSGRMKPDGPVGIKPRPFIVSVTTDVVRSYGASVESEDIESIFSEVDSKTAKNLGPLLKLLPGVLEFLKQLAGHGIDAVVVSTDITSRAKAAMESLGIDRYFSRVLGGDSVTNTKPAPDLALSVIKEGKYLTDKAVVIGDHPVDIKMGLSAGLRSNIGVLTGLSSSDAFQDLECVTVPDLTCLQLRS